MGRTPPADVIRALRREVAFGCPICRDPFLTWHHFDPPYAEGRAHDANGMIALCVKHHAQADGGHFSKDYLRSLKRGAYSIDTVSAVLPWMKAPNVLVRLGGSYVGGSQAVLTVDGEPVIEISRCDDGLLGLYMRVRATNGADLLHVHENVISPGPFEWTELETDAHYHRVKLWLRDQGIGVEMSHEIVTGELLRPVLEADLRAADAAFTEAIHAVPKDLPEHIRALIQHSRSMEPQWVDSVPPDVREMWDNRRLDRAVIRWIEKHCDRNGEISFLNIDRFVTHRASGARIEVAEGRIVSGSRLSYVLAFDNAGGAIAL